MAFIVDAISILPLGALLKVSFVYFIQNKTIITGITDLKNRSTAGGRFNIFTNAPEKDQIIVAEITSITATLLIFTMILS